MNLGGERNRTVPYLLFWSDEIEIYEIHTNFLYLISAYTGTQNKEPNPDSQESGYIWHRLNWQLGHSKCIEDPWRQTQSWINFSTNGAILSRRRRRTNFRHFWILGFNAQWWRRPDSLLDKVRFERTPRTKAVSCVPESQITFICGRRMQQTS